MIPQLTDGTLVPDNLPFLSPSTAKILTELTPYHAYMSHYMFGGGERPDPSDAAKFGTVVDRLVFGTGPTIHVKKPRERVTPDRLNVFVSQDVYDKAVACAKEVIDFAALDGVKFLPEHSQPKWKWQAEGQVWCSARPDYFNGTVIDLKSSYSLKDSSIQRTVREYGYDIQAAAYLEAARAVTGERSRIKFLFVESKAPYACRWVELDQDTIGAGMGKWLAAVATWKECLTNNYWPGWSKLTVNRPNWAKKPTTEWID